MLAALAIAAVTLLNDIPNGPLSREVVANIGDQLLDRVFPDARDREQAAFVTIEPDGSVGCMLWPLTDERAASTYHGVVPPNAVAIIHTHPHEWILPSPGDALLSQGLRLPVLVVTHGWIGQADPSGEITRWRRFPNRSVATPACRSSFLVPMGKSWSAGEPADQPSRR